MEQELFDPPISTVLRFKSSMLTQAADEFRGMLITTGQDGSASPASNAEQPAAPLPLRILIADDNRDSCDWLAAVLRMSGNNVHVAGDGEEALRISEHVELDVVLLDIGMPGMDGYDVARSLRARLSRPQPVLVALTGWAEDEDRRQSKDAGFDHHLIKPVSPPELLRILASLKICGNSRPTSGP